MAQNEFLKQLQKTEFNILLEALAICERLGLRVYAVSGTCLGAVKYGGFIPWDDDIDIALPRRDYDIFVREASRYLPSFYFLQTRETDPEYYGNFAKIRDSRTTFVERSACKLNINHGVYIDVFPLDGYPEGALAQKMFAIKKRIYTLRISKKHYSPKRSLRWRLMSALAVILVPSADRAWKKREALFRKIDFDSAKTIGNFGNAWDKKEIVPREYFASAEIKKFEGSDIPVHVGYEKYLAKLYGDITKDPPESEQIPHHYALMIDLEKSYLENNDVILKKINEELKR